MATEPVDQFDNADLVPDNQMNVTPKKKIRVFDDDNDESDAFDKYKETTNEAIGMNKNDEEIVADDSSNTSDDTSSDEEEQ